MPNIIDTFRFEERLYGVSAYSMMTNEQMTEFMNNYRVRYPIDPAGDHLNINMGIPEWDD
jgi:hypothetical protein